MMLELLGFPEEYIYPADYVDDDNELYICRPVPGFASTLFGDCGGYSLWVFRWPGPIPSERENLPSYYGSDNEVISFTRVECLIQASALIHDFIQRYERGEVK